MVVDVVDLFQMHGAKLVIFINCSIPISFFALIAIITHIVNILNFVYTFIFCQNFPTYAGKMCATDMPRALEEVVSAMKDTLVMERAV